MSYRYIFITIVLFSSRLLFAEVCAKQLELANGHLINKQRVKMAKAINKAIENKQCVKRKIELKKKLAKYFELFLTDESQHNYEQAKTAFESKPQESKTYLLKSLKDKSYNWPAIDLLQRIYFREGMCEQA